MTLRASLLIVLATASQAAATPAPSPTEPFLGPADRQREGKSDLDGDGHVDCWSARWDGGSGFGGFHVEVRARCAEPAVTLDSLSSFGEFLSVATFAAEVPTPVTTAFQAAIREGLYPGFARRCARPRPDCPSPSPSFAWLLDEARTRGHVVRSYRPIWSPGLPTLPSPEVMDLDGPDARRLVMTLDGGEPAAAGPAPRGVVVYAARNHGATIAKVGACARWDLYATAHGVAVFDRAHDRSSWVFIGTGADKLRHPSILAASCDDGNVTVEHRGEAGPERVVVDPLSGRWQSASDPIRTPSER